jgi:hypothetical protein
MKAPSPGWTRAHGGALSGKGLLLHGNGGQGEPPSQRAQPAGARQKVRKYRQAERPWRALRPTALGMRPTPRRGNATTEGAGPEGSYPPATPPVRQDDTNPASGQETQADRAGKDRPPGRSARRPTPEVSADQPKPVGKSAGSPGTAGAGRGRPPVHSLVSGRTGRVQRAGRRSRTSRSGRSRVSRSRTSPSRSRTSRSRTSRSRTSRSRTSPSRASRSRASRSRPAPFVGWRGGGSGRRYGNRSKRRGRN